MSLSAAPSLAHPTLPEGQLLYAVGDIHGRLDLLASLLGRIEARCAKQPAMPNVARSSFSATMSIAGRTAAAWSRRLIGGLPQGFETHFLKGNHEAILLDFLDDAWRLDHWLMNGGEETMRSYGVDTERLAQLGAPAEPMAPGACRGAARGASCASSPIAEAQRVVRRLSVRACGRETGRAAGGADRSRSDLDQGPVPPSCRAVRQDRGAWAHAGEGAGDAVEPHRHRYRRRASPGG